MSNTSMSKQVFTKTEDGYDHPEAFCLMRYKCQTCGAIELVWNSRDGVTPFIIGCRNCDEVANHVDWNNDMRKPDYQPTIGMRIFVDLSKEECEKIMRERINTFWEDEDFKSNFANKEVALQEFMRDYHDEGEPHLIEVTQDVLDDLSSEDESSQENEEKLEEGGCKTNS